MQSLLTISGVSSRGFFAEQSAKGDNQPRSTKIKFCNTPDNQLIIDRTHRPCVPTIPEDIRANNFFDIIMTC
ncbi:MAG: hypothetical protein BHV67_05425 [Bacteroidales bacterium 43_36]|nr:MAG: hypothetical protein BHV67_05425 [Bacteroidales bacterium 43_36]